MWKKRSQKNPCSESRFMNEKGAYNLATEEARPTVSLDTIAGKLKTYCPSLFYSLLAWERDSLDPSIVLEEGNM